MKNFLFFVLTLLIAQQLFSQAPVVLTQDDFPAPDNNYLIETVTPPVTFDPYDTGADHNWDFSDLEAGGEDTSVWVEDSDTDPIYFFLWLSSDIAESSGAAFDAELFSIEDVYNFYQLDDDIFAFSGFGGKYADIPLPIAFDEPETIVEFPAEFGQETGSVSGFDIEIPGYGGWSEVRTRENEIDGWGSITTPAGTFDVLRIRSEIFIQDVITYDIFEIPIEYTTTEYRWMAPGEGIPVLQITMQEILGINSVTSVSYKTGELTAIENPEGNPAQMHIINPARDVLHASLVISTPGEYTFSICDLQGKQLFSSIETLNTGIYFWEQQIGELATGYYVVSAISKTGDVFSGSFIKQ